jgi:hypothetical protein
LDIWWPAHQKVNARNFKKTKKVQEQNNKKFKANFVLRLKN